MKTDRELLNDISKLLDRADRMEREAEENPKPMVRYSDFIETLRKKKEEK